MEYEPTAHAKHLILYHVIFVCKYRKKLLIPYGEEVKQIFEEIASRSDFSFEATFSGPGSYWSDGYFCCTIGNANQDTIRRYIEQQG